MTIWTLTKGPNRARAITRAVPGLGRELRYDWNGDLRQSQVYRTAVDLFSVAFAKREELLAAGWAEAPPIMWGT